MSGQTFSVRDLSVSYGKVEAVRALSFNIERGSSLALVGHNGAGKSSTLLAVGGGLSRTQYKGGISLLVGGESGATGSTAPSVAVALVPEREKVFSLLSVHENFLAVNKVAQRDGVRIDDVYSFFPRLAERRHTIAGNLSGGEQQMLAIGSALLCSPDLLLIDEPTLGLAVPVIETICLKLRELRRELDLTLLIALAETVWVSEFVDAAIVMDCGERVSDYIPAADGMRDCLERHLSGDGRDFISLAQPLDDVATISGAVSHA